MGTHPALEYAKRIAYSSEEVLMFSYEMAKKYASSPGVYCELGVAAGAQIIAMAAGAPNKTIYAFDSFEGIPLPSNKDDQMPGIKFLTKTEQMCLPNPGEQALVSSGATSVSRDDYLEHLDKSGIDMSKIYSEKGWFEETVPMWAEENSDIQIAILRLDGDLYNSTYVCLKYLYPKVIEGGIVIIDDWALEGCKRAFYDFVQEIPLEDCPRNLRFIKDENSTVAHWIK